MYLNNLPVINVTSVNEDFSRHARNIEHFDAANSQTFKAINGYGQGAFLVNSNNFNPNTTNTVDFKLQISGTSSYIERTLFVTDCLSLTHTANAKKLYLVKTAERKYFLEASNVTRNYNVVHTRYLNGIYGRVLESDGIALTIRQIIENILGGSITVVWNVEVLYGYNLFIQGMSKLAAIDLICSVYGLIWTMEGNNVYFFKGSLLNTSPGNLLTKVNDLQVPTITNALKDFSVNYKIAECCIENPISYITKENNSGTVGKNLDIYCPYVFAVIDTTGSVTNDSVLTDATTYLRNNFEGILSVSSLFIVRDYVYNQTPDVLPVAFETTYSNYGYRNQTTFYSPEYPFVRRPEANVADRQAKNWVGTVAYEYKGIVPVIQVNPQYGIDGQPPLGIQIVANLYNWNYGQANAPIRVEWDCVNRRWIPLQQAYICPPASTPPPPPDPPLPEGDTDLPYGSWI